MTELEDLRVEMSRAGLGFSGPFIVDDQVHRFKAGDDREANSWYSIHNFNGLYVAVFGCWKRQLQVKWTSKPKGAMSREDWSETSRAWKDLERKHAEEQKRAQDRAREKCKDFLAKWNGATSHMYLTIKDVKPFGPLYESQYELYPDWLALPLQDITGTVHSMQFIDADGTKKFLYQGRVQGCFYPVSKVPGGPVLICEGYATGASLYEATGWTTICAMNCGNLMAVAKAFREQFPNRSIVICADNDQFTEGNPGLTKARETVKAISGILATPDFSDSDLGERPTDFNDLHRLSGLREVRMQVMEAFPIIGIPVGLMTRPAENDPTEIIRDRYLCECGGMLFNGPTGVGKCLDPGTPVIMFDGSVKRAMDVIPGDLLMGPDSLPRKVLQTCRGQDQMYRVDQKRRDSYVCNSQHVLTLKMTNMKSHGKIARQSGMVLDVSLPSYLRSSKTFKHCAKGVAAAVDWPQREVPLSPYFLGLWLGDGTSSKQDITTPEREVQGYIHAFGARLRMRRRIHRKGGCQTLSLTRGLGQINPVLRKLRALGVLNNKHIPFSYRVNCRRLRLELLAGLIDSDGHVANKCCEITTVHEQLSRDIPFLARSLGFRVTIAREFKKCQTGAGDWYWRMMIAGDLSQVPTKVQRKQPSPRRQKKNILVSGIKITPIGLGDYCGFTLEGDGRFLLGDFTITHNSSWALQEAACWTNGLPFFGFRPAKPLKFLIIQAENDEGDIAQVRDSVCTGLNLTEEQRKIFFEYCIIYTADRGHSGLKFCQEVLRPLLDLHAPHIVDIDPLLSFVGGNVKEQENVTAFLRAYLNPELKDHRCACKLYHHTNKPPTGKEKPNWVNGEMAYMGTGSSELANWARAIVSLQSLGKAGYYKLHAAKRGARLGWRDEEGQVLYERVVCWSRDGGIYWRDPTAEEIAEFASGQQPDDRSKERQLARIPYKFKQVVEEGPVSAKDWLFTASGMGISKSAYYRYVQTLLKYDKIFLSKTDNRYYLVTKSEEPERGGAEL